VEFVCLFRVRFLHLEVQLHNYCYCIALPSAAVHQFLLLHFHVFMVLTEDKFASNQKKKIIKTK
jgi:hypothetical protein